MSRGKQARAQADALAKEVYDRLFTTLVHEVGGALGGGEGSMVDLSAAAAGKETLPPHIGLLDIFGFTDLFNDGHGCSFFFLVL